MYFTILCAWLARNFKIAVVKFGNVCFTNKSCGTFYYKKKEMFDRK